MTLHSTIFYGLELLAALSAIAILFIRNVFYGALLLIVCLISIAGLYVFALAEFVAVTQILVYAGGILVVIIFGIMLTSKSGGRSLVVKNSKWFAGLLVGILFFSLFAYLIVNETFPHNPAEFNPQEIIEQTGILLMTDFILPFETAGILLLVALVGAAVITSAVKSIKP
jgi:NADH-quinone oxidoreductase subunit J